jgi:hypothetical protein
MNKQIASTSIVLALLLFANTSYAFEDIDVMLGARYEHGRMGNTEMNVPNRDMNALWVDGIAAKKITQDLALGIDLDIGVQRQQTDIQSVNRTNEQGWGWLAGVGATYRVNDQIGVVAAADFAGKYYFSYSTSANQSDYLDRPFAWRIGTQYFPPQYPGWSADLFLHHIDWRNFVVSGSDNSHTTAQSTLAIGLSYHFATGQVAGEQPSEH